LGVKDDLWEVQWHPAGSGQFRRVVLTRRGLRRTLVALAAALLVLLAIVCTLPFGLRGLLTSFTVDAAKRENRTLRLQGDSLREQAHRLAHRVLERVERGRRVAWVIGALPGVWEPPSPAPPAFDAGDEAKIRWLTEQGTRLQALGVELSLPHPSLRCPLSSLPIASPIDRSRAVPTALFGWRVSPFTGKTMANYGTILAAPLGEPVLAPGAGRVLFAGSARERRANEWTRLGKFVVVDHGGGVVTVFAHLRDVLVRRGQTVTRAQRLGSVGQTGWTRVPALYYEVRWPIDDTSRPIDPGIATPTLPVENLDARLADPTGGLPSSFASLRHLIGARAGARRPVRPTPTPHAESEKGKR
jgi:murein DD-endopeptidase MepM/ murein hydrolase activator NlpD